MGIGNSDRHLLLAPPYSLKMSQISRVAAQSKYFHTGCETTGPFNIAAGQANDQ